MGSAQESSPYYGKEEADDPSAENQTPEVITSKSADKTPEITPEVTPPTPPATMMPVEVTDVSSVDTERTATSKDSASSPTALEVVPTTTSKHKRIKKDKTQKKKKKKNVLTGGILKNKAVNTSL